jgi:hypothetical protein
MKAQVCAHGLPWHVATKRGCCEDRDFPTCYRSFAEFKQGQFIKLGLAAVMLLAVAVHGG